MSATSTPVDTQTRVSPARRSRLIRTFRASGGSQAAFCREHGLHPATFSAWLRKAAPEPVAFQEVQVERPAGGAEFHFADGTVLRLADPSWIAPVLRALREAGPC